eukprot:EG_transcript_54758
MFPAQCSPHLKGIDVVHGALPANARSSSLQSNLSTLSQSHPENHFEAKQQLQNVSQALSPKFTVVLLSTVSAALAVFLRGRRRSDSKPLVSAAHYSIAMASTTSVKPAWEQKKALDPKK